MPYGLYNNEDDDEMMMTATILPPSSTFNSIGRPLSAAVHVADADGGLRGRQCERLLGAQRARSMGIAAVAKSVGRGVSVCMCVCVFFASTHH